MKGIYCLAKKSAPQYQEKDAFDTHHHIFKEGENNIEHKWHWWHFCAVDTNAAATDIRAVYLFEGKNFNNEVDLEKGNFDYLMGCNLDIANPDIRKELLYWGEWYSDLTGVDGFRFDAVKYVGAEFFVSKYAFGEQNDNFDQQNCIGWTRAGNAEHPGGMAVLLSNDADSAKSMNTGSPGVTYEDVTEHIKETVTTNGEGWAEFRCKGRSVSVWVPVDESLSCG